MPVKHWAIAIFFVVFALTGYAQPRIEYTLSIPSKSFAGRLWTPFMPAPESGEPVTVTASLSLPPGKGKVPVVVITHGCDGMIGAPYAWLYDLKQMGYGTLLIDSFSARKVQEICTGIQTVDVFSILADVYAGLDALAAQPRVDISRVALMGFSFGGRTALWANQIRFQQRYSSGRTHFAAHLAFYPVTCFIRLADEEQVSAPLRIFNGSADDWTPPQPCREYATRMREAGKDAALIEYPDAHHAFDKANMPFRHMAFGLGPGDCRFVEREGAIVDAATGLPGTTNSPCMHRGVSSGYNAAAHKQSLIDVHAFLRSVFERKALAR